MNASIALTPAEALCLSQEAFLARMRLMISHRELARVVVDPDVNPLDLYDAAASEDFRRFVDAFGKLQEAGEFDTLASVDRTTARTILDLEYGDQFSGSARDLMVNLKAIEIRAATRITRTLLKEAA